MFYAEALLRTTTKCPQCCQSGAASDCMCGGARLWRPGPHPPAEESPASFGGPLVLGRPCTGRRTPGQETAAFPRTTWGLSLAGPGPVPAHQPSLLIQQRPDWHRSQSGAVTHIYHRPFKLLLPRHPTLNNTRIFSFVPIFLFYHCTRPLGDQ